VKKLFFLLQTLLIFTIAGYSQSQNHYHLDVTIDGLKDTTLLLGYHFGDKKFVTDTAQVDAKGHAIFSGDTLLHGGIYLIILPNKTYFEVLISDNQQFSLRANIDNPLKSLSFTNSDENNAFIEYQRFMVKMQDDSKKLSEEFKDAKSDTTLQNAVRKKMNKLNDEVEDYWNKLIDNYKGKFLGAIAKAMKPVDVPDANIPKENPKYDSLVWIHGYLYNKDHFFDNIDFSDARLLRTPLLENKMNTYFDRVIIPQPDSVTQAAINLVEKSRANKEMFQYVLSLLTNKFQSSERMGMDGVFVALAEKYYMQGEAWWADQSLIDKITERAKAIKPNMIGKVTPDLWLSDPKNKYHKLSDIKAKITVVFFWDPECSHCKVVTPKLKKTYDKYKDLGFEVYAVYTQGDEPKWVNYIDKNSLNWINVWDPTFSSNFRNLYDIYSTPVIYVLDANKKIIAKRISEETLEKILEEELKK